MPYRNINFGESLNAENVHKVFKYDKDTGILYRSMINGRLKVTGASGRNPYYQYLVTAYNGRQYRVTHIIWLIVYGKFPTVHIDHINTIQNDNRLINLREATQTQNRANTTVTTRSKSGVKGVFWDKERNRWSVYITSDYKTYFVGRYDDIEDAKKAYKNKATELWGEFART